jgi:hypothetical protein
MKQVKFYGLVLFWLMSGFNVLAQEKSAPELSVNNIKLGDRESGKAFLTPYLPTTDENGRPAYYFYNNLGTQVLKLTAASFEDLYFLTEIEVFIVGKSYQKAHNYLEKTNFFVTESKIFIGYRQSTTSMIIGIPNVSRNNRVGPKDLVKKKGEPTSNTKEGEREIITYNLPNIEIKDEGASKKYDYFARYEFVNKKLQRFILRIKPPETAQT